MQNPGQSTEPTPLHHLDGQSYPKILSWLEDSLRGQTALPRGIPGESPELCIIRFERFLESITRRDLGEACRTLVRRFANHTGEVPATDEENDYVGSLLYLARALELNDVSSVLRSLVSDPARFSRLPTRQQKSVIGTLLDMKVPLSPQFWQTLADRYPERLGVFAFSGMLRERPDQAFQILLCLPDDLAIADSVHVVLGQRSRKMEDSDRDRLVLAARSIVSRLEPQLASALTDWLGEQAPVQVEQVRAVRSARLDAAFSALNRRKHSHYQPIPMPARLQPTSQQAHP